MGPDGAQIGTWLKKARERHGQFSQEQVAPMVGTTTRTMGAWERGETVPPADKFFALVLLYKADVLQLLAKNVTKGGAADSGSAHERKRREG